MTLKPFAVPRFGGVNRRDDPQDVGPFQAISATNVDLDVTGAIRTREGANKLNTTSGTGDYYQLIPYGTNLLAVRESAGTAALDSIDGVGVRTQVGATFGVSNTGGRPVAIGVQPSGASTEQTLVFFPSGGTTLRKYDGSAHAASVGQPWFVCVSPVDNRLVQAKFTTAAASPSGADGSLSTVFFSDPGAPETFDATNFVHLRPGDKEVITGVASWREMVFVLKETVGFVFYGTGTDATGAPVFNYRTINLPDVCRGGVTAGDRGVYYYGRRGVYRTRGDTPEKVSSIIGIPSVFEDNTFSNSPVSWAHGRLCVCDTSNLGTWVYDEVGDYWLFYQYATSVTPVISDGAQCFVEWGERVAFLSDDDVFYSDSVTSDRTTDDDGTAITWSWQSGWYGMGPPGADAFTRWTRVWGTGTATVSVFTDHGTTDANAGSVSLGTSPAVAEGYHLKSYKGQLFSHKLSGSGVATVNRLQHDVASVRP